MKNWKLTALVLSASLVGTAGLATAEDGAINHPTYADSGAVMAPTDYREWVFVGAPLTPNALNGGPLRSRNSTTSMSSLLLLLTTKRLANGQTAPRSRKS